MIAGKKCKAVFLPRHAALSSRWKNGVRLLARRLPSLLIAMPYRSLLCAVAAVVAAATPVSANDLTEACHAFGSAEVIFVGRVKSAPITRRISGENEIEKARLVMEAAERELKAFEALKVPPEIGWQRHRDLTIRMVKASEEYGRTRAMYPPPVDLSLTPLLVEIPFRGVKTTELFMMNRGQPALDPARSYLFYAQLPMGFLAPDVIFDGRPKEVESAEADLQFLRDVVADDRGTTVHGSLRMQDPDDERRMTPLGGVVLRVSLDGQHYEKSTAADGTFLITGVPPGLLRIDPVLPGHLTLPPQQAGGIVKGGCLAVHMRATLNGRISGHVVLDSGEPFRGLVDLERHGHTRYVPNTYASTNDRGEFSFSAVPPGDYLIGINVSREPSRGAAFRPTYFPGTTDRTLATPVTVGLGTEHTGIDWAVSSTLAEGTIEVTFDTQGQPQKNIGVCVTTFDARNRSNGGAGYQPRSTEPVIVQIVEGVKYRIAAYAQTPAGPVKSETFDFIGSPGRRSIRLSMASSSAEASGMRCASDLDKPFSP